MQFMIRCDLEGVSGVVDPLQVTPGATEYAYGVAMLQHDLQAVVMGLLTTGNHDIWVYDMHGSGRNIDISSLPEHVRVVCGKPNYRCGVLGGLTKGFAGQILLGFHSRAGSGELLAHTYEHEVLEIRLNGTPVGEIALEAALAGELAVPTILVTGDSAGCWEAREQLGDITTVTVKESCGPRAGVCYSTAVTAELLHDGVREAVNRLRTITPYTVTTPVTLEITLAAGAFADHIRTVLASAVQSDGVIRLTADSVAAAWEQYLNAKP